MMTDFNCAYIPIGVPTFHLESAKKEFEKSIKTLECLCDTLICPDDMLLSTDELAEYLDEIADETDVAVVQNITFANSAYISIIAKRLECPIILWTLREPVIDGGRLRLNSLTGAFSAANTLKALGRNFEYVFGSPAEDGLKEEIESIIKAAVVKKELGNAKILQVGHTPQGFGFGRAEDAEMQKYFGVTLESIEARELIDAAKEFSSDDASDYLKDAEKRICGLKNIDEKNNIDFAKLYKAYYEYCKNNGISALSSRCWPDFFTAYKTPVCAVLAMLNDLDIPAACEADTYGALTMLIASKLTGKPVFFGDPVSMDENENTITFWHCGTAACSLARSDTKAQAGLHCNRKIGPTLDFGCKAAKRASMIRVGKSGGKFRIFIASGEILDKPKQFEGTSLVFKADDSAERIIKKSVKDGWEPHFAVSYDDITREITALGNMLGIEVYRYQ